MNSQSNFKIMFSSCDNQEYIYFLEILNHYKQYADNVKNLLAYNLKLRLLQIRKNSHTNRTSRVTSVPINKILILVAKITTNI